MVLVSILRTTFSSIIGLQLSKILGSLSGFRAGMIWPIFIIECRWHKSEEDMSSRSWSWRFQEQALIMDKYLFRTFSSVVCNLKSRGFSFFSWESWSWMDTGCTWGGQIWNTYLYIWAISSSTPAALKDFRCRMACLSSPRVRGLSIRCCGDRLCGFSRDSEIWFK